MQIQKYDTLKDATGQTWRVMDIEGKELKIKKIIDGKNTPGRASTINITEVGEQYRLLDLPKVTVSRLTQNPEPNLTVKDIDDAIIADTAEVERLREELETANIDIKAMEDLVASLRREINQLKQEHESEVAELNDEIMELKILAKKKNEYADALDDDSVAFGRIRSMAAAVAGMSDSIASLAFLIQDEAEEHA